MRTKYTLATLANLLNGSMHGNANKLIQGVASLSRATVNQLAYFDNPALLDILKNTNAGAVLLSPNFVNHCPVNSISVSNPFQTINKALSLFTYHKDEEQYEGIDSSASIASGVKLGSGVSIGSNSSIGEGAIIGDGVKIATNCVISAGVSLGNYSSLAHNVSIHEGTQLGANCIIESGVVIGAAPFNNAKVQGHWHAEPAVGGVVIGDNVRLGANTVIARGSLGDTIIGLGVCIDNLVHIAHDVIIGAHTAIAGCATVGAFAHVGMHCIIGGASCVGPYINLMDDVVITGMSTVSKSISRSGIYSSGTLVSEHNRWRKNVARFRRLDDYVSRLIRLEKESNNPRD